MGIWDAFSELMEAATPWSIASAEAAAEKPTEEPAEETSKEEEDAEEDGSDEEEEEEEEEELVDPKDVLEEECRNSKQCSPAKHHFDECVERVENGSKESCVEEFFHLTHCATQCAAPKLWAKLK